MSKISSCHPAAANLNLHMTNRLIHPGDTVTTQQVVRIYDGVIQCSLPKPEWTHGAHLCAGTAIVLKRGLQTAEHDLPGLIKNYNIACGVKNTQTDGYHHTITIVYLRLIAKFLEDAFRGPHQLGSAASALLGSDIAAPDYLLGLYSRDLLFSPLARGKWQAPDLRDLL